MAFILLPRHTAARGWAAWCSLLCSLSDTYQIRQLRSIIICEWGIPVSAQRPRSRFGQVHTRGSSESGRSVARTTSLVSEC